MQTVILAGPPSTEVAGIIFDVDGAAAVTADDWVKRHVTAEAAGVRVSEVQGRAEGVGDMILDLNEMFAL